MDRKYQAEDDARIMRRYAELQGDSGRLRAAQNLLRTEVRQTQALLTRTGTAGKSTGKAPGKKG
jgi:hypothetical protein